MTGAVRFASLRTAVPARGRRFQPSPRFFSMRDTRFRPLRGQYVRRKRKSTPSEPSSSRERIHVTRRRAYSTTMMASSASVRLEEYRTFSSGVTCLVRVTLAVGLLKRPIMKGSMVTRSIPNTRPARRPIIPLNCWLSRFVAETAATGSSLRALRRFCSGTPERSWRMSVSRSGGSELRFASISSTVPEAVRRTR